VPSTRKLSAMPSAIKILSFIPYCFSFGENLYRYKNILLKSSNNIFAIPSGHGIETPAALSCPLHLLCCEVGFSKCFYRENHLTKGEVKDESLRNYYKQDY
jgi:hypothetical protein